MSELPLLTVDKRNEIRNRLNNFPLIKKYYGGWLDKVLNEKDPRTYPVIKQFLIENYDYLNLITVNSSTCCLEYKFDQALNL